MYGEGNLTIAEKSDDYLLSQAGADGERTRPIFESGSTTSVSLRESTLASAWYLQISLKSPNKKTGCLKKVADGDECLPAMINSR